MLRLNSLEARFVAKRILLANCISVSIECYVECGTNGFEFIWETFFELMLLTTFESNTGIFTTTKNIVIFATISGQFQKSLSPMKTEHFAEEREKRCGCSKCDAVNLPNFQNFIRTLKQKRWSCLLCLVCVCLLLFFQLTWKKKLKMDARESLSEFNRLN